MDRQRRSKPGSVVDAITFSGVPLFGIYCYSMFLHPWIAGNGSWEYVQAVWDRWQTFNAAALAFGASVIALNITKFSENRQREREFIAAKAFLPSALSGLMEYLQQAARVYESFWESAETTLLYSDLSKPLHGYREVFSNCIRHAEPEVGAYMSKILVDLQVHEARLRDAMGGGTMRDRHTLIVYIFNTGELHSLVGNLFEFARSEEDFREKTLTWDELRNSYLNLDIEIGDIFIDEKWNLEAFTHRRLQLEPSNSSGA